MSQKTPSSFFYTEDAAEQGTLVRKIHLAPPPRSEAEAPRARRRSAIAMPPPSFLLSVSCFQGVSPAQQQQQQHKRQRKRTPRTVVLLLCGHLTAARESSLSFVVAVVCRTARHGGHERWIERCARGTASGRTIRSMFNNRIMLKRGSF